MKIFFLMAPKLIIISLLICAPLFAPSEQTRKKVATILNQFRDDMPKAAAEAWKLFPTSSERKDLLEMAEILAKNNYPIFPAEVIQLAVHDPDPSVRHRAYEAVKGGIINRRVAYEVVHRLLDKNGVPIKEVVESILAIPAKDLNYFEVVLILKAQTRDITLWDQADQQLLGKLQEIAALNTTQRCNGLANLSRKSVRPPKR